MNTGQLNRWRLILGGYAKNQMGFDGNAGLSEGVSCVDLEEALDFLYITGSRATTSEREARAPAV